VGSSFLDEVQGTVSRILHTPPLGINCLLEDAAVELTAFRLVWSIKSAPDEILITSVMEWRRDPVRWKDLL